MNLVSNNSDSPRWLHWLAVLTALLTLPLLFLGAGVTSHGVGMVDPRGFRPPWEIVNGLLENSGLDWRLEYGHRTFGFLVGMCGIVLAVGCWFGDRRPWIGWMGLLALTLICIQGSLGIFRVDYNALHGRTFAMVHGVFAQIVFAVLVSIAVLTARSARFAEDWEASPALKRWSLITTSIIFGQLVLGGITRHQDSLLGPRGHLLGAFVVVIAVIWLLKLIRESERFTLARVAFMGLLALQLLLGMESWLSKYFVATSVTHEAIVPVPMHAEWVRTLHYVVGSMILATSVSVAILAQRKPVHAVEPILETSRRLEGVA
ncbi:MAG TPA: COX15/CtaA family protein [Gemmataceae bacterium]|nr:COX15/CtaA family protein [Gemmataceae bacterium]